MRLTPVQLAQLLEGIASSSHGPSWCGPEPERSNGRGRRHELPGDVDALQALILAERAAHAAVVAERDTIAVERDQLAARIEKLEYIVAEMQRACFGRSSERIDDNQLALALEALETTHAKVQAGSG